MRALLLAAAATLGFAAPASAAFFDSPVPANAYITFNGLDWAWAAPCSPVQPSCDSSNLLSYQGGLGWRLPTAAELAAGPAPTDFIFAGANVPFGGSDPLTAATFFNANPGDGACATPYFSDTFLHCDYGDALGGFIYPNLTAFDSQREAWLVRVITPAPATLALFGLGVLGLVLRRR